MTPGNPVLAAGDHARAGSGRDAAPYTGTPVIKKGPPNGCPSVKKMRPRAAPPAPTPTLVPIR